MPKDAFHARMEQAEPGLFRAFYRGTFNPNDLKDTISEGPQILPDMHIGTDPAALKTWVEEMAHGLGYDTIEWETLPPELNGRSQA